MHARTGTALDRALAVAAAAVAALLTCAVMLGVVSRAFNAPFIWTDEVSRFLMVWLAAIGWMMASRTGAHIRIRYFHDLLPPRLWAAAEFVMQAAIALCGGLIAWFGAELVVRNANIEATTVPIAMSWLYLPVVIAGLLTAAQGVFECIGAAAKLGRGPAGVDGGPDGGLPP